MTLVAVRPVAPAEGPRYPAQSTYKRGEVTHISPPWPLPGPPSIEAPLTLCTQNKPDGLLPALKTDAKRIPASLQARQHRARKVSLGGWSGDGALEDPDSNSTHFTCSTLTSSVCPPSSSSFSGSTRNSRYSHGSGKRSITPLGLSASMLSLSRDRRSTMDLQLERMESGIEEYHRRLIDERKQRRSASLQIRELAASLQQTREEMDRTQAHARRLEEQFASMQEQNAVLELQLAIAQGAADDAEMRYREERDAGALVYTWYTELLMELHHLQGQPCTKCASDEEEVAVVEVPTVYVPAQKTQQQQNTIPEVITRKVVPSFAVAGEDVAEDKPKKSWGRVWDRVAAFKAKTDGSKCATPTSATQGVKLLGSETDSVRRGVVGKRVSAFENKM